MKKLKVILSIIFALALSLFTVPTYADSPADIVYTIDSSNENLAYTICDNSGSISCSGYSYVLINYNFTTTSNYYFNLTIDNVSNRVYWPKSQYNQIFSLYNPTKIGYGVASTGLQSGQTITITLSASQGCPSCPTPEPCPDPVDAPYFVQLVINSFWQYHTAFAGAVVSIIVIFLVYRLLKGRLK